MASLFRNAAPSLMVGRMPMRGRRPNLWATGAAAAAATLAVRYLVPSGTEGFAQLSGERAVATSSSLRNLHVSAPLKGQSSRLGAVRLRATSDAAATTAEVDFEALSIRLKDVSALEGIGGLLGWDEMAMMSAGAAQSRAAQKAALAGVIHAKSTDVEIGVLLDRLKAAELAPFEQASVREAARAYKKATAVPESLVRRESELESRGYQSWVEARQKKDWSIFAPVFGEWVEARRERAAFVAPSKAVYDALADDYSAGMTAERVAEIFNGVKDGLVPLLAELREKGTAPDADWLKGDFEIAKQADLCKEVVVSLGFDLEKGRVDTSVHPFTGGSHPTDVRITTRFKPDDLTEGLTGAIHEAGHALYEQGRNLDYDGMPVNAAAGMAIHESQSLLWERMVGLSLPFSSYLLPKLHEAFPDSFPKDKTADDLYAAMNTISTSSKIRVEADEVNYPLHVILRFEIEKNLVEGNIKVEDVPALWNKKMKEYLGVEIDDDGEGCLQDLHWSMGAIGYFPTYTMGAIAAVQIFEAAERELPELAAEIEKGIFITLRNWLKEKVHSQGSLHPTADELLVAVTGKPLDPESFVKYLEKKYKKLYKIE